MCVSLNIVTNTQINQQLLFSPIRLMVHLLAKYGEFGTPCVLVCPKDSEKYVLDGNWHILTILYLEIYL